MGTPAISSQFSYAVDDSSTADITDFDANSFRYEFESESLGMKQTYVHAHGMRGTRSLASTRTRIASETISGNLVLCPTPVELDQWLPRILGAQESTDVFALAESLPFWSLLADRYTKRFVYKNCNVDKAVFSWSAGGMMKLTLSVEAESETVTATSFTGTIPAINGGVPYASGDCTVALAADASFSQVSELEITIDNMVSKDRFMNSVTRANLPPLGRNISVRMVVPYTDDEVDLYDQAYTGGSGSVTFTLGNTSCAFAFGNLKAPASSPVPSGPNSELMLTLDMQSFYVVGGARELVVTNDSTT